MVNGKLGRFIKTARLDKGMEQKSLARGLGKSPSSISQIEAGQLLPGDKFLLAICRILDLDFKLAWHMAQVEKARPGLARQASLAALADYEGKGKQDGCGGGGPGAFEDGEEEEAFAEAFTSVALAAYKMEAGRGRLCPEGRGPACIAFRKDWLERLGGRDGKVLLEMPDNAMSPLIEKGDIIMVDQSRAARRIKPGRIYVLAGEKGPMVKRIYFGRQAGSLILASENSREHFDHEISLKGRAPSFIIGRVLWLGRQTWP